jgi:carbonic anhydrase
VLKDPTIQSKDWQEAVEHGAVGQAIANLMTFPFVRSAYERGNLAMHGAWFSIGKGALHWRDPDTGAFSIVAAEDPVVDQDNKI